MEPSSDLTEVTKHYNICDTIVTERNLGPLALVQ